MWVHWGGGTVSSGLQLMPALAGSWLRLEPNHEVAANALAGVSATAARAAAVRTGVMRPRSVLVMIDMWTLLVRGWVVPSSYGRTTRAPRAPRGGLDHPLRRRARDRGGS